MATSYDYGRQKWPSDANAPIAFMYQPDEYEVVTPDRMGEWERLMRERVGFPEELIRSIIASRLIGTISIAGGQFVD